MAKSVVRGIYSLQVIDTSRESAEFLVLLSVPVSDLLL